MTYTYDALGNLTTVTDPNGNTMTFRYNGAGELTEKTDIHGCTTRYTYNSMGQVETITDPDGNTTTHEYAPGGRHLKTTYPGGSSITYTYDAGGRVKTRQHSNGYTLTYTYDSLGRITEVRSSKNQKKTYAYDAMGNVTAATDANGNTTRYTYTMGGKLATVTDPMGNTTEYAYDPLDNLTAIRRKGNSGGKDHATVYERDPFGRVLCITDPLGRKEHFRYDALGRPVWKKDRDGNETVTAYTMTGQTAGIRYADGTAVEMQYDALDRLTRVKDSLGTTSIGRDRTGRITAVTGHNGQTVSYEWGAQGERKSTTYPDGQQTVYSYDSLQRLTAVQIRGTQTGQNSTEDPQTITCRYDDEGRLTEKVFPDGIRTTWQYDREDGLPVSLTHTDKNGVLDRYTYAYDPMGNKTAVTRQRRGLPRESGAYTYTYDSIGRLAAVAKDGTPLRDYAYDPYSNRAHMTDHHKGSATAYTYDAADRLTMTEETTREGVTRKTYGYDHRGNLTKELQEGIPVHSYAYNAMDRLKKAWSYTQDGAVQTEAAYHYNGLGQRVGKSMYTGAAGQIMENMEQPAGSMGAAVREDYLIDLTRPYHNLLSVTRNDGAPAQTFYWDRNAAAMEENGRLHYYLQDEMGSPVRVSGYDGTESMADGNHDGTDTYLTYGYDEFGNDPARTIGRELEEEGIPNPYTMQGEGQPFGYTGYRYDTDSGTYFAQAREYQPQSGRFCAQDVVAGNGAVPVTLNRYGYCLGNPLYFVDLNGMWGIDQLIQGWEAHRLLQAKAKTQIRGLQTEYRVTSGINWNKTGTGKADIAYFNAMVRTVEVYEIKPSSYAPGELNYRAGLAQLDGYVYALGHNGQIVNGWGAERGSSLNLYFDQTVIPSNLYEGQYITYHVAEDGLIIYEYSGRQPQESTVTVPEKEYEESYSVWERIAYGVAGTAVMLGAGVLLADDLFTGGVGVADNGIAVGLASFAMVLLTKAIHGTGTDNGCDIS